MPFFRREMGRRTAVPERAFRCRCAPGYACRRLPHSPSFSPRRFRAPRFAETVIPLTPDRWTATNTIRFETYLGRPSLYIDKGVAVARGTSLRDGTIELDMAMPQSGNFMGAVFHASSPENSEAVYFRPRGSGTPDAVQYAPALNSVGAAWKIYHGDGANAVATLPVESWGPEDRPRRFGRERLFEERSRTDADGAVLSRRRRRSGRRVDGRLRPRRDSSNIRYTARQPAAPAKPVRLRAGRSRAGMLSDAFDATAFAPATMPNLAGMRWKTSSPSRKDSC